MTKEQERAAADFVKKWRHKRFCTCRYIVKELKLKVSRRTVARSLNESGFYWRPVPKKHMFSESDLRTRKAFWEAYGNKSSDWWVERAGPVPSRRNLIVIIQAGVENYALTIYD